MRTLTAFMATLMWLTMATLSASAQTSIPTTAPAEGDIDQILPYVGKMGVVLRSTDNSWRLVNPIEFTKPPTKEEIAEQTRSLLQQIVEEQIPWYPFPKDGAYNVEVSLSTFQQVGIAGRQLNFTVTGGKLPAVAFDFSAYGKPSSERLFYVPVSDPLVKWVVVEEIFNGFQSRVIDTVNGSWPDGCWLQTDLKGNGFLYLPTFVFANDGVRREMTRYYDESRTLWRRTVIGTGDVVAVSNPPPPEPKPLRLAIAINMYGKTEVQILGDGAETAEIQQSVDLVHWVPASSLSSPPALSTGARKHTIIVSGTTEAPFLYYRARANGGLQKL